MANRNKKNSLNIPKAIGSIVKMNSTSNQLLNGSQNTLNGSHISRNDEMDEIYSQFQSIVRSETSSILNNKASKDNVYDYLVRNVFNLDPANPASYAKMEKEMTGGDTGLSNYFMGANNNFISLCDQIESICAYLYQLEEAIDTIRDNVLACEEANAEISVDVIFPDTDGMASEYAENIKQHAEDLKIPQKLKDHIVPKAIKFGSYYVITMPYNEIYTKMASFSKGVKEGTVAESVMEGVVPTFESIDTSLPDDAKIIYENASKIRIFEQGRSDIPVLDEFKPIMEGTIDSAIIREITKANNSANAKARNGFGTKKSKEEDQTILDGQVDLSDDQFNIPGCFIKLVDPRYMLPVRFLDHVIGYYYFEHFDNSNLNTSITDIMANKFNFNGANTVLDNIVDKILKNLKYKDLIGGSAQFKSLILNSLMYKESRENLMNIKFVPAEYVVDFSTNKDEKGNGRPVLLRSLFFGRLYVSLLNFNITTLVTKSTDTEFYYMRQGLDGLPMNQISDVIEQMRSSNIDPSSIMNGDLLHGSRAIYKRYFSPLGEGDQRPFEVDVVPGQKIDLHDELMDKLLKMTIGSTGVPSVMIDNLDEVDYAIMVAQAQIKHMRRCISIQTDFNGPITQLYKNIQKYSNSQAIKPEILDEMKVMLRKPRMQHNNYQADSISVVQSTVSAMVDTYMKGQNTSLGELDEFVKEELLAETTMELTPSLPWASIRNKVDAALLKARERQVSNSEEGQE